MERQAKLVKAGRPENAAGLAARGEESGAAGTGGRPARAGPIVDWLLAEGRHLTSTRDLIGRLCVRLVEAGIPLRRLIVAVRTLHPLIVTSGYRWVPGTDRAEQVDQGHDILNKDAYLKSPIKAIHDGAPEVRRRLEGPGVRFDFPILEELLQQGATDYLALPLVFGSGRINVLSLTTDRPGGLSDDDVALIQAVREPLSAVLEIQSMRRIGATLMDTYLGHQAGARVLDGQITRGSGESIHAVVWYSDLRGFTPMSDELGRAEVIAVLNDYFECVIEAIEAGGGEVLKLIGDGVLAIFPLTDAAFRHYVCNHALDTALRARAAMADRNLARAAAGQPALDFGVALHVGDVIYGNIGAPHRLDFTVIGPAVNHVTRIEGLCKTTGQNILVSEEFKRTCERPLISAGRHQLRGIDGPQEVFTHADGEDRPAT